MPTLLYVNSSARSAGSVSRQLSAEFVQRWLKANPSGRLIERNLTAEPIPHIDEELLGAFFTEPTQRTPEQQGIIRLSDELIDELFAADVIVIAAPMYNFSIASTLKAYLDHVIRSGRTFKPSETGTAGLLPAGKRVVVFTARGWTYSDEPAKSMDFHETYLRAVLGFIGLSEVEFVHTEGLALGPETAAKAVEATRSAIPCLVAA